MTLFWPSFGFFPGEDPTSIFLLLAELGDGKVGLALLCALVESPRTLFGGFRIAVGIVRET